MFKFKVYEWEPNGALGWQLFDTALRKHKCHGEASHTFFGTGTYNYFEARPENNEMVRIYQYGSGTVGRRLFKFVKEVI